MGDVGDDFRALKSAKQAIKDEFGIECPVCLRDRPKGNATIMLPQQRCKVCGYRDPRIRTNEHQNLAQNGWLK